MADRDANQVRETERTVIVDRDRVRGISTGVLLAAVVVILLAVLLFFFMFVGSPDRAADDLNVNINVEAPEVRVPEIEVPEVVAPQIEVNLPQARDNEERDGNQSE